MTIAYIKVDDGEHLEKAIKRFKRMVEKEGIIREWKKREYYEKPSTVRAPNSVISPFSANTTSSIVSKSPTRNTA